jgi:hypothetical protein
MTMRLTATAAMGIIILIGSCTMTPQIDVEAEKAAISEVVHNSIGWAATKDTTLSYSCFAHDPELFWFSPEASGTIRGFEALKRLTETVFMKDEFQAVGYEIREMRINLSQSGTVAWYSCRLDDTNTWNGQPFSWDNVRWTGVLEKRDGRWVIVQMHFSYAVGEEG